MASFWGEILPVTSRAVTDDDDDEDDEMDEDSSSSCRHEMRECDVIWNPEMEKHEEKRLDCRLLIVADGDAAVQFVDAALLWQKKSQLVAILNSGFVQTTRLFFQPDSKFPPKCVETSKCCTIHRLLPSSASSSSSSSGVVIVRNTATVFPEQLSSWYDLLFSRLRFDPSTFDVVVLSHVNLVHYLEGPASTTKASFSSGGPEMPFLRSLLTQRVADATSSAIFSSRSFPPRLEAPNLLTGISAQILTRCQISGLRGAAFVVYAAPRLEAATIQAFVPLLSPGGCLHGIVDENPAMNASVKDFVLKRDGGTLLYT